jgi:hypothetical protein
MLIGGEMKNNICLFFIILTFFACQNKIGSDESSEFTFFDQSADLSFGNLYRLVLSPKCLRCHSWINNEDAVHERIIPGSPEDSSLFLLIDSGKMPVGGPELNLQEKQFVYSYIKSLEPLPIITELKLNSDQFAQVKNEILIPKCVKCHRWMKQDAKIMKRIRVGEPESSRLYLRVADNTMPIGGPALTDSEKNQIFDLILGE